MGAVRKLSDWKCLFRLHFHAVPLCTACNDVMHLKHVTLSVETFQYFYEQFSDLKEEISEAKHPHCTAGGWAVCGSGVYSVYHSVWQVDDMRRRLFCQMHSVDGLQAHTCIFSCVYSSVIDQLKALQRGKLSQLITLAEVTFSHG